MTEERSETSGKVTLPQGTYKMSGGRRGTPPEYWVRIEATIDGQPVVVSGYGPSHNDALADAVSKVAPLDHGSENP